MVVADIDSTYVSTGEVTPLEHEIRNHTVKLGTLVAKALFSSAQSTEILSSLGDDIVIQVEIDAA